MPSGPGLAILLLLYNAAFRAVLMLPIFVPLGSLSVDNFWVSLYLALPLFCLLPPTWNLFPAMPGISDHHFASSALVICQLLYAPLLSPRIFTKLQHLPWVLTPYCSVNFLQHSCLLSLTILSSFFLSFLQRFHLAELCSLAMTHSSLRALFLIIVNCLSIS